MKTIDKYLRERAEFFKNCTGKHAIFTDYQSAGFEKPTFTVLVIEACENNFYRIEFASKRVLQVPALTLRPVSHKLT